MTEANLGEAPEAATQVDAGAHQQLLGAARTLRFENDHLFTEFTVWP